MDDNLELDGCPRTIDKIYTEGFKDQAHLDAIACEAMVNRSVGR